MNRARPYRKNNFRSYLIIAGLIAVAALGIYFLMKAQAKPTSDQEPVTAAQRNDVRRADLKLIAGALNRYTAEVGPVPIVIPTAQTPICAGSSANCKKAVRVDLMFLASKGYLNSVPNDPVGGHEMWSTGYTAGKDASGKFLLKAPRAEAGAEISQAVN